MRQIFDLYIYILYLSCHILHISALTQQYQSIYLSQHLKTFKLQNCVSLTRLLMICQSLVDLQTYKLLLYKHSVRMRCISSYMYTSIVCCGQKFMVIKYKHSREHLFCCQVRKQRVTVAAARGLYLSFCHFLGDK